MKRREFLRLLGLTSISPMLLVSKEKVAAKALEIAMPNGYEFVCIDCGEQGRGNIYWPFKGDETSEFYCFCGRKLTYIKNDTDYDFPKRKCSYIPPNDESHPRPPMQIWGKEEN